KREGNYDDPHFLLEEDQRKIWWRQYGHATGKKYENIPIDLNRDDLHEITSQPLLNYLVALSFIRGELDFSQQVNLNTIYEDLLKAIYERAYADGPLKAVRNID